MAQEFASDNSKKSIFARLKLSTHRGFFSFIFVTLSVIFILITFAAVQQQQTTNTKASTANICAGVTCTGLSLNSTQTKCEGDARIQTCCLVKPRSCVNRANRSTACRTNCGSIYDGGADSLQEEEQCRTDSCCTFTQNSCIKKSSTVTCENITSIFGSNSDEKAACDKFSDCLWTEGKCIEDTPNIPPPPATSPSCKHNGDSFYATAPSGQRCCSGEDLVEKWNPGTPPTVTCVKEQPPATGEGTKLSAGQRCRPGSNNPDEYLDSNGRIVATSQCNTRLICDPFAYAVCRTSSDPPIRGFGQTCAATSENNNQKYECREGGEKGQPGSLICLNGICNIDTSKIGGGFNVNPSAVRDPRCIAKEGQCQTEKSNPPKALTVGGGCFYNNKLGSYQQGLCKGGAETKCCVPTDTTNPPGVGGNGGTQTPTNTPTPVVNPPTVAVCNDFTTQATCLPADQCKWLTDTNKCKKICSGVVSQNTCTNRDDCVWVTN